MTSAARRAAALVVAAVASLVPACSRTDDDLPTVLIVGDSVTLMSAHRVREAFDWARVELRADIGARTGELLGPTRDAVERTDPDIGVFLTGYNDVIQGRARTGAVAPMAQLAASLPCSVWLELPTTGGYAAESAERFNRRARDAVEDVDGLHLVDDWRRLVENSDDFTFVKRSDAVHPNRAGQAAVARVMAEAVEDHCR